MVPPFLTSALDGGGCKASRSGSVTQRSALSILGVGGWAGPKTGLGFSEIRKLLPQDETLNPAFQPVACHYIH
jgi:hypothetical protein